MNRKLAYLIAAFIVYFLGAMLITYIGEGTLNWNFIVFWTVGMSLFDFFIVRKLNEKWKQRKNTK